MSVQLGKDWLPLFPAISWATRGPGSPTASRHPLEEGG